MQYRNEIKHTITAADRAAICARLKAVAKMDPHAEAKGFYKIRSLYFDSPGDKALREKQDGVSEREKFRIRYYDDNTDLIKLEKKVKRGGLGYKVSAPLTKEEAQKIIDGDLNWMPASGRGVVVELYAKMKTQGLRPRTIVDYERIPFIYAPGNVRVTVDYNIRTGLRSTDFLNPHCVTVPAGVSSIILEVKWDDYLPGVIRRALQLNRSAGAFSKYGQCRIYG
ncbi:MAG: polyphosphate polymerase domain-containing protein [Clostridia bacterium]|nr:polyphosphate polymerase domain-containing protein [Clostridia bacterium]